MKRLTILSLVLTVILLLSACGTNETSPELEASGISCPTIKLGSRDDGDLNLVSLAQRELYGELNYLGNVPAANSLNRSSFRNGKWDGIFGGGTYYAVIAYQQLVFPNDSSEWDGIIGRKTWAKLGVYCRF